MTILVTGASTSLGRDVVQRLILERRAVRLLVRRPFSAVDAFAGQVQFQEWHPLSEDLPKDALSDVTTIVHLMGEPFEGRLTPPKTEQLENVRRTAAHKIIGSMTSGTRLILASTVAVYGNGSSEICCEATIPTSPESLFQKAASGWESVVEPARAAGAQVAIARFGLIVGADRILEDLAYWVDRGLTPSAQGTLVPLIDLSDAVALIIGLIDNPTIEGPINAVAPTPIAIETLIKAMSDQLGVRARARLSAGMMSRILGPGCELLLRRSQVVPRRLIELGCTFSEPDPIANLHRVIASMRQRRDANPSVFDYVQRRLRSIMRPDQLVAVPIIDRTDAARRGSD